VADRVARLTRGQVLGYRAAVSDLTVRRDDPVRCAVLDTGVQDTPPGTTASPALLVRVCPESRETVRRVAWDGRLTVLHSLRGTLHLHRAADAGLLAAGLRPVDVDDVAVSRQGRYFIELQRRGVTPGEALDDVASAMRSVMADGQLRTKGELSGAVTSLVDGRLPYWCAGCGVAHVHDGLFRYATLAAGLAVVPAAGGTRFRALRAGPVVDRGQARRVLLRRFLRACGPCGPSQLAAWLGVATVAARKMWRVIEPELVAVEVAGSPAGWMHRDDVGKVAAASPPPRLRLLPPYDPLTETADRDFVVPDPAYRKRVWRASANPGVVLRRGEVAGVWRRRTVSRSLVVTVEPFDGFSGTDLEAAVADAGAMADLAGLDGARVRLAA
jgi:hypothetical protein